MAYAPHTNDDAAANEHAPILLGTFCNGSHHGVYEYAERGDEARAIFAPDLPHTVYVGAGETRAARVLKTVAYVAVDEAADGSPVLEKWKLRDHRQYPTDWVVAARGGRR